MHVLTVCQVLLHGEAPPVLRRVVDVRLARVQVRAVEVGGVAVGRALVGAPAVVEEVAAVVPGRDGEGDEGGRLLVVIVGPAFMGGCFSVQWSPGRLMNKMFIVLNNPHFLPRSGPK